MTEFKYGGAFGRGKGGLRPRPVGSCPVKQEDVTFIMVRAVREWFVIEMSYIDCVVVNIAGVFGEYALVHAFEYRNTAVSGVWHV